MKDKLGLEVIWRKGKVFSVLNYEARLEDVTSTLDLGEWWASRPGRFTPVPIG
jgi:hypothetical protein